MSDVEQAFSGDYSPEVESIELGLLQRSIRAGGLVGRGALAGASIYVGSYIGVAAGNEVAPIEISAGPFDAEVKMDPSLKPEGGSRLDVLGSSAIYENTHSGARVVVTPSINPSFSPDESLGKGKTIDDIIEDTRGELEPEIRSIAVDTATRTSVNSLLGGLVGGAFYLGVNSVVDKLLKQRNGIKVPKKVSAIWMASIGATSVLPYTVMPLMTSNPDTYEDSVSYTGFIAEGQKYAENYEKLSDQLRDPALQWFALNRVVEKLGNQEEEASPDICVYIASDPHGGGYRIVGTLAEYDAEEDCTRLTIIAGDLTDWGEPFETNRDSISQLPRLPGEVIVVDGNHDSKTVMEMVGVMPNVTDISNGQKVIGGSLRIVGITDPTFTPDDDSHEDGGEENYEEGRKQAEAFVGSKVPVLVVAHNPEAARGFIENLAEEDIENVIGVIAGHTHNLNIQPTFAKQNIPYINPGSVTGGALRLVNPETSELGKLSAVTAYFTKDKQGNLKLRRIANLGESFDGTDKTYSTQVISNDKNKEEDTIGMISEDPAITQDLQAGN